MEADFTYDVVFNDFVKNYNKNIIAKIRTCQLSIFFIMKLNIYNFNLSTVNGALSARYEAIILRNIKKSPVSLYK